MNDLGPRIDQLLSSAPYRIHNGHDLLELLKDEVEYACSRNPGYGNYVANWPIPPRAARSIAELPYLPVSLLKSQPPLALVEPQEIKKVLTSSSTTGQTPSRIALDSTTSKRMTKGVVAIAQDFIGSSRRPYLVVDVPASAGVGPELGARGTAIQGLMPFASEVTYCLKSDQAGNLALDREKLLRFIEKRRSSPMLVYGFTYILWKRLVEPLTADGTCLEMGDVHILHSGGWKLLQAEAVDKRTFNEGLARVFGCPADRVIDFYGMVENVGVIYPDCPEGNKHVPGFADILVRNPLTLEPVAEREQGIVQVCSALPTSFPGNLLLTQDMAEVVTYDGCPCGRAGIGFRFAGRVPKAELRGCGNIERRKQ